jgi:hypothetical protein
VNDMDATEKSFESATETSKLLITLSTGVIAFCVTLLNAEIGKLTTLVPTTCGQKVLLSGSWLVLLFCTGFGIWVQLSIVHVLSQATVTKPADVWSPKIRVPYMLQISAFVLGMTLLVAYGGWKLFR